MVVHNPRPKGTVLFLHGFPETLYAWKDISLALADDYEVHAFDWPGYGLSSRPTVDRFSYAPKDYAHVLNEYIGKAGIDTSKLTIYATDIGALPALLLALEKPGHREDDHRWRLRPVQQAPLHVREPAKPEGGAFDGPGPRPAEQESRRYPRKRFQKRSAQGSPIRGFPGIQGRHVPRMEPRRDDDGGRLLPLLLALYAGPGLFRVAIWPGSKPR